jgi:integrase
MKSIKVTIGKEKSKPFINIYYDKRRYRFWNGKVIEVDLKCQDNPELLKAAFELKIRQGWRPKAKKKIVKTKPQTLIQVLEYSIEQKIANNYSARYIKDAKRVLRLWKAFEVENKLRNITLDKVQVSHAREFLIRPTWSPKTQLTVKSTLSALLSESKPDLVKAVKLKKPSSTMHKPFANIKEVLQELEDFNTNLRLCCIITYGCLLRPHREIRELTWGDFSADLSHIHLSGHRNKSGRNRIVPVPPYIREILVKGEPSNNIFSGKPLPHNEDYFKTLWSRFKTQSQYIEQGQTLYSFRHSGAIEIYKRTGSLTKLQKAMGHSSINVSLTYLRGLEIAELMEEDMPVL